jgi:hypothetical protein
VSVFASDREIAKVTWTLRPSIKKGEFSTILAGSGVNTELIAFNPFLSTTIAFGLSSPTGMDLNFSKLSRHFSASSSVL